VFRQVYLGTWIRRSNVLTGAEWMRTRFGTGTSGTLSHISVVIYALVLSVGFLCYAFQGIGKFAEVFFPWDLSLGMLASADVYAIIILPISAIVSVLVCLITPPEQEEVLTRFYRDVRPWGFWGPVHQALCKQYPDLQANRGFWVDAFNIANGIVWQLTLMIVPICLVVQKWDAFWYALIVLAVTSVIMKFTWYDRLGKGDMYTDESG